MKKKHQCELSHREFWKCQFMFFHCKLQDEIFIFILLPKTINHLLLINYRFCFKQVLSLKLQIFFLLKWHFELLCCLVIYGCGQCSQSLLQCPWHQLKIWGGQSLTWHPMQEAAGNMLPTSLSGRNPQVFKINVCYMPFKMPWH